MYVRQWQKEVVIFYFRGGERVVERLLACRSLSVYIGTQRSVISGSSGSSGSSLTTTPHSNNDCVNETDRVTSQADITEWPYGIFFFFFFLHCAKSQFYNLVNQVHNFVSKSKLR